MLAALAGGPPDTRDPSLPPDSPLYLERDRNSMLPATGSAGRRGGGGEMPGHRVCEAETPPLQSKELHEFFDACTSSTSAPAFPETGYL